MSKSTPPTLVIDEEVGDALSEGRAVVAMESTIYSRLGLPSPHNREAYERCTAAIRSAGAVPALTAVLGGVCRIGVPEPELEHVLSVEAKVSARDVFSAVATGRDGVTTVAASLMLAARAGIGVFATGGMGGVHRDVETSGDVSADLWALARYPVTTVTAGAKAFLDLPRTVEFLDTLGVPLLGYGTDEFPAFYSRSSGVALPHRVSSAAEAAAVIEAGRSLGYQGGFVVANPIPAAAEIPADEIEPAIEGALAAAAEGGVTGAAVTPLVLSAIAEATGGRSIPANLALAESNAAVAAQLAVELSRQTFESP
jgi:pseudouridine-5'-phosphate glycosidase